MKRLWVWTGPVSAAKSGGALRRVRRLLRQPSAKYVGERQQVLLMRPSASRRNDEPEGMARTKDGLEYPCAYFDSIEELDGYFDADLIRLPDILWIDEAHFWEFGSERHVVFDVLTKLRSDFMILLSGIAATNDLTPISPSMGPLLQVADRIFCVQGDCDFCGGLEIATRSVFIGKGSKTSDVQLGGEESYCPACPECWTDLQDLPTEAIRGRLVMRAVSADG